MTQEVTQERMQDAARRVAEALGPARVILFGSHAWGQPAADSDVDLMVVMDHVDEPVHRLASRAYRALRGVGFPVDIVIRSSRELERWGSVSASLERQVLDRGVVLYG